MHPFSVLTLGIFVAGYITARWDLVTRLYELAGFAWNHGVVVRFYHLHLLLSVECDSADTSFHQTRAAKGFAVLSIFFFLFIIPIERFAARETSLVMRHLSTSQFASSQNLAPPRLEPRNLGTRTTAKKRLVLGFDKMRSWSRVMDCYGSSGPTVSLGQPHPV
jgi:hypothetical protein